MGVWGLQRDKLCPILQEWVVGEGGVAEKEGRKAEAGK